MSEGKIQIGPEASVIIQRHVDARVCTEGIIDIDIERPRRIRLPVDDLSGDDDVSLLRHATHGTQQEKQDK